MKPAALLLLLTSLANGQDFSMYGFDQPGENHNTQTQHKDEPIRVFQPSGEPVLLKCLFEMVENKRQRATWFYKRCGDGMNIAPCSDFSSDSLLTSWQLVSCGGLPCANQTLSLPEPSSLDNGLYRCSVNRKVKTTYELAIEDLITVAAVIKDISDNETVWVGQPARLQCRFEARVPPKVMWFLQQSGAVTINLNDTFQLMTAHTTVAFKGGVYVSKLEFSKTSLFDSGVYVCVVVTNVDMVYKQARLTVMPKYFQDVTNLHWLFLVPLALALVPAFTWLVCAWRRKQKVRAEKYAPVTT